MTVSLTGNGERLGAMRRREKAEELMRKAGFRAIEVHALMAELTGFETEIPSSIAQIKLRKSREIFHLQKTPHQRPRAAPATAGSGVEWQRVYS